MYVSSSDTPIKSAQFQSGLFICARGSSQVVRPDTVRFMVRVLILVGYYRRQNLESPLLILRQLAVHQVRRIISGTPETDG